MFENFSGMEIDEDEPD